MNALQRCEGQWRVEGVSLCELAQQYGTPCYIYSSAVIRHNAKRYLDSLGEHGEAFYAVKANSNLSILRLLHEVGCGFDIVSGGELERVLRATGDASGVVFSGVGKSDAEMRAALQANIRCFNLESPAEMHRLAELAQELGCIAPVSFRVNPEVSVQTHPHIATGLSSSKFGVPIKDATQLYVQAQSNAHLKILGISCHIGSQIFSTAPIAAALQSVLKLRETLLQQGIAVQHLDMGGGLGLAEESERLSIEDYTGALLQHTRGVQLWLEPGRSVVGSAGLLLTRVALTKRNGDYRFAVVDAAMNDLIRPALYQAQHPVVAVTESGQREQLWQVVGPVCESGDFLAQDCTLNIAADDLLAIEQAGAYGFSMSSNYNTRVRAAEVLVTDEHSRLIRERECVQDLLAPELSGLEQP